MKKLVSMMIIILLVAFSGSQVMAQSYMRWIDWPSQPNYIATADDMAQVFYRLSHNEIQAGVVYSLRNGVTYKISKPELYLDYIRKAVRAADAGAIIDDKVYQDIAYSDTTNWGNDIPYIVKNYYVANNGEVRFFSSMQPGVPILLVNGIPVLKRDCGNPLEVYSENYKPEYKKSALIADSIKTKNGHTDTVYVLVQLEDKEDLPRYQTTYCYWGGYGWSYSYFYTYPVYYPYYYSYDYWGFYTPVWWHRPVYVCNSFYYHPYYHGYYNYHYCDDYYGRHNENNWHHGYSNGHHQSFDRNHYEDYNKRYSGNSHQNNRSNNYSNQNTIRNTNTVNNNSRTGNNLNKNSNTRNSQNSVSGSYNRQMKTNTNKNVRAGNDDIYSRSRANNPRNNNRGINSVNQNKSTNTGNYQNQTRQSNSNTTNRTGYGYQRNNQSRVNQNYTPNNSNNRGTNNYSPSRSSNYSNSNRNNVNMNNSRSNSGGNINRSSGNKNGGHRR